MMSRNGSETNEKIISSLKTVTEPDNRSLLAQYVVNKRPPASVAGSITASSAVLNGVKYSASCACMTALEFTSVATTTGIPMEGHGVGRVLINRASWMRLAQSPLSTP